MAISSETRDSNEYSHKVVDATECPFKKEKLLNGTLV